MWLEQTWYAAEPILSRSDVTQQRASWTSATRLKSPQKNQLTAKFSIQVTEMYPDPNKCPLPGSRLRMSLARTYKRNKFHKNLSFSFCATSVFETDPDQNWISPRIQAFVCWFKTNVHKSLHENQSSSFWVHVYKWIWIIAKSWSVRPHNER